MTLDKMIWTEKYRPTDISELVLDKKDTFLEYLNEPMTMPSFIFYSSNPGTGKTTTAKVICKKLGCDNLMLNSSDERGIDTIRDKINQFVRSLSSNPNVKRCVFLDEADGLTKPAQDSLRNLMETYSDNCFFIFSCNDLSKLIEPIRSRCVSFSFEKPDKKAIIDRLKVIVKNEGMEIYDGLLEKFAERYYPDIRQMILKLQEVCIYKSDLDLSNEVKEFELMLKHIREKDIPSIYTQVYSGTFDVLAFNRWLFRYVFDNFKTIGLDKAGKIALLLADNEKAWNTGANLEVIAISNFVAISSLF